MGIQDQGLVSIKAVIAVGSFLLGIVFIFGVGLLLGGGCL